MARYVGFKIGKVHEEYVFSEYYCGSCGFPVTDHDSFCPECGGAFRESDADDRGGAITSARDYKMDVLKEQLATSQKTEMLLASENVDLRMENAKMRELIHDLLRLPTAPAFDCFHCKYEEHDDCDYGRRCKLVERARDLEIEVTP